MPYLHILGATGHLFLLVNAALVSRDKTSNRLSSPKQPALNIYNMANTEWIQQILFIYAHAYRHKMMIIKEDVILRKNTGDRGVGGMVEMT